MMSPLINGCISDVMEKLADHVENGSEFNIYLYYKRMTMDVICKCIQFLLDEDRILTFFRSMCIWNRHRFTK
jgi:hypothetical protein